MDPNALSYGRKTAALVALVAAIGDMKMSVPDVDFHDSHDGFRGQPKKVGGPLVLAPYVSKHNTGRNKPCHCGSGQKRKHCHK